MIKSLQINNPNKIIVIAFLVLGIFSVGRFIHQDNNITSFIIAGSDFVDTTQTISKIKVNAGQGYDGQFYYRLALNPFNYSLKLYGITIDHPTYRVQRIAYPFIVWILSFGGQKSIVPWMMLFVNLFSFAGIFYYFTKFLSYIRSDITYGFLPFMLYGIYMATSRNLGEVVELFFFTGTLYYLFKNNTWLTILFASITLLTRETSLIALAPLLFLFNFKKENNRFHAFLCLVIPVCILLIWKGFIYLQIPVLKENFVFSTSLNMIPFKGIIDGLKLNLVFNDTKNQMQFIFWISYLLWNILFNYFILKNISFNKIWIINNGNIIKLVYLFWLVFALFLTDNIYGDDWGFVRIFSVWNMIGFFLIALHKIKLNKYFIFSSFILIIFTFIRLVIRV